METKLYWATVAILILAMLGLGIVLQDKMNTLSSIEEALSSAETELVSTEEALAEATTQVRYRDPTYSEVMKFINEDQTDSKEYIPGVYVCQDFAADVNLNAESQGIRTAYVAISYPHSAHAIVAFNTVDKGIVYIEPQYDDIVVLPIGESYSSSNGYDKPSSYDDTIVKVTVVW